MLAPKILYHLGFALKSWMRYLSYQVRHFIDATLTKEMSTLDRTNCLDHLTII